MRTFIPAKHAADVTRMHTGIVIPVYLPVTVDRKIGESLLRDNVAALIDHVSNPTAICLSVDGHECGEDIAQEVAREYGTRISQAPQNKGKLNAINHGMRDLLEETDHRYLAVIDQDGDHFGNELVNLVRVAEHITSFADSERVMVLGQRRSRHRPMGLLRGEMEELADRVLLDALQYHASVTDRPLRLE
ncbi:MAG: glycosyltransferase, partial [Candidatus Latescibacteria bacterium]|nr:glycosyltransferase [Candidatus Latescibacterota bacterium]